jgi:hypothetical protein
MKPLSFLLPAHFLSLFFVGTTCKISATSSQYVQLRLLFLSLIMHRMSSKNFPPLWIYELAILQYSYCICANRAFIVVDQVFLYLRLANITFGLSCRLFEWRTAN